MSSLLYLQRYHHQSLVPETPSIFKAAINTADPHTRQFDLLKNKNKFVLLTSIIISWLFLSRSLLNTPVALQSSVECFFVSSLDHHKRQPHNSVGGTHFLINYQHGALQTPNDTRSQFVPVLLSLRFCPLRIIGELTFSHKVPRSYMGKSYRCSIPSLEGVQACGKFETNLSNFRIRWMNPGCWPVGEEFTSKIISQLENHKNSNFLRNVW